MSRDLTPVEEAIVSRAGDLEVTRRRIRMVWVSAVLFAAALVALAYLSRDWRVVTAAAVLYVVINTIERVAYGRAVLAYKSIIQKLLDHSGEPARTPEPGHVSNRPIPPVD